MRLLIDGQGGVQVPLQRGDRFELPRIAFHSPRQSCRARLFGQVVGRSLADRRSSSRALSSGVHRPW